MVDMDMHMDSGRNQAYSRLSRGIILLGDSGTFVSRQPDHDMGDRIDESHDLESHMLASSDEEEERSRREETPAPQTQPSKEGDTLQPKTHVPSPTKEKTATEATTSSSTTSTTAKDEENKAEA